MVLGVATITAFLFLGSEETIDAPRLSGAGLERGAADEADGPAAAPVVRIVGGTPPASGPVRLTYGQGSRARFRVITDAPATIAVLGYGIEEDVRSGDVVSFRAIRRGQFAVVAAASRISLASIRVVPR